MRPRCRVRWIVLGLALVAAAGCTRDRDGVVVTPPFDDGSELATLRAAWSATGEGRAFAGGARLAAPEAQLRYRVDAESHGGDKVFVRLGGFQLVDESGHELARDRATTSCVLGAGATAGVLRGEVWVPKAATDAITGFRLDHFAAPLGDDAREELRAWLLRGRPDAAAEVDAEIARWAAAPPCPAGPPPGD